MEERHYCFNTEGCGSFWGILHIPIAKYCSMQCSYCNYRYDRNITSDYWRPGTSSGIVEGEKAIIDYLKEKNTAFQGIKIIGVSGPGDPLENIEQMKCLVGVLRKHYPEKYLCMCTNGSIYNDEVQWLLGQPVLHYITLTINTMNTDLYPFIYLKYHNSVVKRNMWENQLKIIRFCVNAGIKVKVNTVYQKGINDSDICDLFAKLYDEGVNTFNLIPMIRMDGNGSDDLTGYEKLAGELQKKGYPMLKKCLHCRSDSCSHCGKKGGL